MLDQGLGSWTARRQMSPDRVAVAYEDGEWTYGFLLVAGRVGVGVRP